MNSRNNLKKMSLLKDWMGTSLRVLCAMDWTQSVFIHLCSECSIKNLNPWVMLEDAKKHSF